ncbi:MAG TPA: zinc ribbon domain-containing protein, partial [Ktedonobacteraceae bacterium]|nr:zinc ribbon domain-containing protein [Ktedonobacteraceae bacterium]
TPPAQDTSAQPAQPQAQPPVQDTVLRCPNCGNELPKVATFCPKCGKPLSGQPPRNLQGQSSAPPSQQNRGANNANNPKNMSSEPTMIYAPSQSPTLRRKSPTGPTGAGQPGGMPQAPPSFTPGTQPDQMRQARQMEPPASQFSARALPAQVAQPAMPRPFLQTMTPSSRSAPDGAPSFQISQEDRHAQSISAPPATPSPNSNHLVSPAGIAGGTSTQKLVLYAIFAFGAILVIILILLVSHLGAGHSG